MIELIKTVQSQTDDVTKYVFKVDGIVVEASFIDKHDGKHIICMPSQTRCSMGCKFCQMTELGGESKGISKVDLVGLVSEIKALRPRGQWGGVRTLLVSFMGGGEPMLNRWGVAAAMAALHEWQGSYYEVRRFAVASIAPSFMAVEGFANSIRHYGLNCKFHLSLHSVDERTRRSLMPATGTVPEAIRAAAAYQYITHNQVEVHYTLIEGVNDYAHDALNLAERLRGRDWTVKIIDFNPIGYLKSESYMKSVGQFREYLHGCGITTEFYTPPGRDIGASCGQFIAEEYKS